MAIGVAIGVVVLTLIVYLAVPWRNLRLATMVERGIEQARQCRIRLLCETSHQALLEAGREILAQVHVENRAPDGRSIGGSIPVPSGVPIPQAILDLHPHAIVINYDHYLTIEMHGGMEHFGVRIYPEDFNEPDSRFKYGDRKLLEGLWYYDDEYLYRPDEYDRQMDVLIADYRRKTAEQE